MNANTRAGKRPFTRRLGAMLVSGQLVLVLALLLSNVGAVQAQIPADETTGTETPTAEAQEAENGTTDAPVAEGSATEVPPTDPSATDTSVPVTPTPEADAPMSGVPALQSAGAYGKISPGNGALVPYTNQFQLKWGDAGIDVETPGGDSYLYCIDQTNDDLCDTGWVEKRNLQTAAGDVVVAEWQTYYWQVKTDADGAYANCPGCWWNFTVVPNANKVISGSTGLPGTHVGYVGTTNGTVNAGPGGAYSITVPNGWSGTVTPSLTGYSFTPPSRSYLNILTDQTSQNYTPGVAVYYTISGDADLDGVVLNYVGAAASGFAVSVLGGGYSFSVPSGWTGTVTPSKIGYIFSPVNYVYAGVVANQVNQDFTATAQASSISRLYPAPGSTDCLKPKIGVFLQLNALMLNLNGTFNPSTVTLKLDNVVKTLEANINDTGTSPASQALILYTPPANLSAGIHWVTFIYPTSGGPVTDIWYFNVSNTTCSVSAQVTEPTTDGLNGSVVPDPAAASAEELASAAAEANEQALPAAPAEPSVEVLAPAAIGTEQASTIPAITKVRAGSLQPRQPRQR